ncbi:hypothetical protein CL684_00580 [Candidatus Campbellbacteria bacterium]|mgnify:CR=1 FL=1|nr:hypothetical protein [Candidatus Campbellbacteria bacterium]|tara:strand:+ start:468 stop:812 length:345 start_codon:yes stop_codon:yes gene_type:complete
MKNIIAYLIGLIWTFGVAVYVFIETQDISRSLIQGLSISTFIIVLLVTLVTSSFSLKAEREKNKMRAMTLDQLSSYFQDIQHTADSKIVDYAEQLLYQKMEINYDNDSDKETNA